MTTSAEMIAGTGAQLVVARLEGLIDQADTDLVRAPEHLRLYRITLKQWIYEAAHRKKADLNRQHDAGVDVVRQFGGPLPSPSVAHMTADEIRTRARLLQHHGWLWPVVAGVYRAGDGNVFGVGR